MRHDFWKTIRRLGHAGAVRAAWQHEAAEDFDLIEPFLSVIRGYNATHTHCRLCGETRFISELDDGTWVVEPREWCGACQPEKITNPREVEMLELNRRKLAQAIAAPLKFIASKQHGPDKFGRLMTVGACTRGAATIPVDLLLPTSISQEHFDAVIPRENRSQRVLLHLGLDVEQLLQLMERNVIAINLPEMLVPLPHGTFKPVLSISEALARAGIQPVMNQTDPEVTSMIQQLRDDVRQIPRRTSNLLSGSAKRRLRIPGVVTEDGFSASAHFRNIHWRGRKYTLEKTAAIIIETLYIASRNMQLPGLTNDEIFAQAYGSDVSKWPAKDARVQDYFRKGDAKRLQDDGFIYHNGKANFFLQLPEVQQLVTKG